MAMTRRRRTVAALLAAFALVFAQVAAAAHACETKMQAGTARQVAAHPECCPRADTTDNVCAQHCEYGSASVDGAKPLPAIDGATGPLVAVLAAPRVSGPALGIPSVFDSAHGPPPDARPLQLRI
jgi:hypothetical protein